jgi:hypothetical protein
MGFFDWEVTNLTKKGVERKIGKNIEGDHLKETSMRTLTSLNWGRMTCHYNDNQKGGACLVGAQF